MPTSAWRITADLRTHIERRLNEAGHRILWQRFVDENYRHWQIRLLLSQTVDVTVASEIRPGTVTITVRGDDAASIRALLRRYGKLPILRISSIIAAREWLRNRPSHPLMRSMSEAKRLKFAISFHVCRAGYKVVRQADQTNGAWLICLKTTQQLLIEGFDQWPIDCLTISGFGTDVDRLKKLMILFQ